MSYGARKSDRVDFERGIPVYMMGIDGTWRRHCLMIDVPQTGARLIIESSLDGFDLKEFFLLLSSTSLAYWRRCKLANIDGNRDMTADQRTAPAQALARLVDTIVTRGRNNWIWVPAGHRRELPLNGHVFSD